MHVDMDAFFAAIEQRDNPSLKGKPVIVGGDPKSRGVVATCSYEARAFGVHSAMPSAQAYRLCPEGIFIQGHFEVYGQASRQIKEILTRFTPLVEMVSIDEAFLDLSGTERLLGPPPEVARKIKAAILAGVGITCSVGIGPNKLIAKIASDLEKPDGLTIITSDQIAERLYPLPVSKLWGVGPVTYEKLRRQGIATIGDFAARGPNEVCSILGEFGLSLLEWAKGCDDRRVLDEESETDEKSISHELTLEQDVSDLEYIQSLILSLAEKVVIRMQKQGWLAGTAVLRVRFANFETITRQKALAKPTDDLREIYETVRQLVPTKAVAAKRVRLVGVRVTKLTHRSHDGQTELFSKSDDTKRERLDSSLKKLRDQFGDVVITRAGTMLTSPKRGRIQ
jgi:nucleotidyltransferase/DNA polymerase involved in DNA repair